MFLALSSSYVLRGTTAISGEVLRSYHLQISPQARPHLIWLPPFDPFRTDCLHILVSAIEFEGLIVPFCTRLVTLGAVSSSQAPLQGCSEAYSLSSAVFRFQNEGWVCCEVAVQEVKLN
jgi:hypothetical protein